MWSILWFIIFLERLLNDDKIYIKLWLNKLLPSEGKFSQLSHKNAPSCKLSDLMKMENSC